MLNISLESHAIRRPHSGRVRTVAASKLLLLLLLLLLLQYYYDAARPLAPVRSLLFECWQPGIWDPWGPLSYSCIIGVFERSLRSRIFKIREKIRQKIRQTRFRVKVPVFFAVFFAVFYARCVILLRCRNCVRALASRHAATG